MDCVYYINLTGYSQEEFFDLTEDLIKDQDDSFQLVDLEFPFEVDYKTLSDGTTNSLIKRMVMCYILGNLEVSIDEGKVIKINVVYSKARSHCVKELIQDEHILKNVGLIELSNLKDEINSQKPVLH